MKKLLACALTIQLLCSPIFGVPESLSTQDLPTAEQAANSLFAQTSHFPIHIQEKISSYRKWEALCGLSLGGGIGIFSGIFLCKKLLVKYLYNRAERFRKKMAENGATIAITTNLISDTGKDDGKLDVIDNELRNFNVENNALRNLAADLSDFENFYQSHKYKLLAAPLVGAAISAYCYYRAQLIMKELRAYDREVAAQNPNHPDLQTELIHAQSEETQSR